MTLELYTLLVAVVLGLIHLSAASFSFRAQVGNAYAVGARDEDIRPVGVTARLYRANTNFLETFPYFAACVLVVHLTETAGDVSGIGAMLYVGGRLLFLPLYAIGVPWLRTFSWNIATLGLVMVGAQALL